jgi:hypothetical protein
MPFAVKLEFDRLVGARCGVDPVRPDTRGDPPIAIARPLIDQSADVRSKLDVADPVLGPRLGRVAFCRSMMFERETASVAVIVFTGNLPEPAIATARSVFLPLPAREPP